MASLGKPETVLYTAKNLASGLPDIFAKVIKPNGDIVGPFSLVEMSEPEFAGVYKFEFLTDEFNDPLGTYVGVICSPSELNYRTPFKITFDELEIAQLNDMVEDIRRSLILLRQADVELNIEESIDEIEVEVANG